MTGREERDLRIKKLYHFEYDKRINSFLFSNKEKMPHRKERHIMNFKMHPLTFLIHVQQK